MNEDDVNETEMVMPFVSVVSKGGVHDDASYVAGAEMAQIDVQCAVASEINAVPCPRYVRRDNVEQLDLVAMRHAFSASFERWDEDPSWMLVTFTNSRGVTAAAPTPEGNES